MAIDVPEGETYEHVPALTGGTVTKTGAGPDGKGALRYTKGTLGDQIFRKVVLTADAAMGGLRSGTLEMDMQGHMLTWKGSCLMSLGCAWKNFGAIVGTPVIDRDALPAPYMLKFSDDRKTLFLVYPRGTTLVLR